VALLLVTAIGVTGLLAICSKLLLGQFNFVSPTVRSAIDLSSASALLANHSASWSWAPYDNYLLVPPAIVAAYVVLFARRRRPVSTAKLFIGITGAVQLSLFALLQFVGSVQTLERHYFSSVLWSSVNIMLAVIVAELAQPFVRRSATRHSDVADFDHRPSRLAGVSQWLTVTAPAGLVLGVGLRRHGGRRGAMRSSLRRFAWAAVVVVITGTGLVLTVAPGTKHPTPANTVYDPPPLYASALGGNDNAYVAEYAVSTELPAFVGRPAYPGEVLLTWEPRQEFLELQEPMGIFHNRLTWVSSTFPVLRRAAARHLAHLHPGQVLLMSLTGQGFAQAVRSLAPFQATVIRRAILSSGWYHLHLWLIDLRRYLDGRIS
jgi:hypothetical protein